LCRELPLGQILHCDSLCCRSSLCFSFCFCAPLPVLCFVNCLAWLFSFSGISAPTVCSGCAYACASRCGEWIPSVVECLPPSSLFPSSGDTESCAQEVRQKAYCISFPWTNIQSLPPYHEINSMCGQPYTLIRHHMYNNNAIIPNASSSE
jgi:hypothetical protein